ncbi:MAG: hypothetical protein ACRDZY_00330 [Acidimicrobiales bacterium]
MDDALHHLPRGLAAAAALDSLAASATTGEDPLAAATNAERERHLAEVTAAARVVRTLADQVDAATDTLAWTLYVHGNQSQDEVAHVLGYGKSSGGRSKTQVLRRVHREQARRVADTAVVVVQAAASLAAEWFTIAAPKNKANETAAAAAVEQLRALAAADSAAGTTERTTAALEAMTALWGRTSGLMLAHVAGEAARLIRESVHQEANTNDDQR